MQDIYPNAPEDNSVVKLDKNVVADACINEMEAGQTKAQAIGPVLDGSDDVATFNEVWNAIVAEGKSMRAVNVLDYATVAAYKAALQENVIYLDVDTWYAGILDEKEVSTFADLKAAFAPQEV